MTNKKSSPKIVSQIRVLVSIFTFFLPIVQSLKFGGVQFPRAIEVTGQFLGGLSKRVRVSRPFCHLKRRRPLTQLDVRAVVVKINVWSTSQFSCLKVLKAMGRLQSTLLNYWLITNPEIEATLWLENKSSLSINF